MSKTKLFVLILIASEGFFFVTLLIAYVYFGNHLSSGPASAESLDPKTTGFFTIFLLSSSLTAWRARKNFLKKRVKAMKGWLIITIVFGMIFMYGQVSEYLRLYSEKVTIYRNIFGSNFFTLTGFHGLHVVLGLLALLTMLSLVIWDNNFHKLNHSAVEGTTLYWHFVDGVWVVVFTVVYLIPLLTAN